MTEHEGVDHPGLRRGSKDPLIRLEGLKKAFPIKAGVLQRTVAEVRAVDGVDLEIGRGETLGLVGESGCGKTTIGRLVLRLIDPTAGRIIFDGTDITELRGKDLQPYRKRMQIVFQDPFASLDPRQLVGDCIGEGLRIHKVGTNAERRKKVADMMDLVGPAAIPCGPLPARVQRRPASAHRHRPCPGAGARDHRLRRAGLGAGRVHPGPGAEPAQVAAGGVRADVPVHRPQPRRGRAHQRPRGGDVPRSRSRADQPRAALPRPASPVHDGPDVGHSPARPHARAQAHHPHRRRAQPGQPARGLQLPPTLLAAPPPRSARGLCDGRPPAGRPHTR